MSKMNNPEEQKSWQDYQQFKDEFNGGETNGEI